jgi:hypothetical protein
MPHGFFCVTQELVAEEIRAALYIEESGLVVRMPWLMKIWGV